MVAVPGFSPRTRTGRSLAERMGLERFVRSIPIRWRILSIAFLNTVLVLTLAALLWDSAKTLSESWTELRQVRQSDRLVVSLESEAGRLQSLIHRYFNEPNQEVLTEIVRRAWTLSGNLTTRAALDPLIADSVAGLVNVNEQLMKGFDALRAVQSGIGDTYEHEVLQPSRTITELLATIDRVTPNRDATIWPAVQQMRAAFSAALVSANAYYLSLNSTAANDARVNLRKVEDSIPGILGLADNEDQRAALRGLAEQSREMRLGINDLAVQFATRERLLRQEIDGNQAARNVALDKLAGTIRTRELLAQQRFDDALGGVFRFGSLVALVFLTVSTVAGVAVAASIARPLDDLKDGMRAIVAGEYAPIRGLSARDEIGDMARALEVFRANAIAKRRAESELVASKERAEMALRELQEAQESLIEAEKLAALGGLVAGVAHEVNNPVGISLTVASSLVRRCETFAQELETGQLRKSKLKEFLEANRDAAQQLVSNLYRAGELIQAFKQVAVDRSHADRRLFDLREASEQIVASLRPGLRKSRVELVLQVPDGIVMDSYPGPYGQVVTNLVLNAATHAFADREDGRITISAVRKGDEVEIAFRDDGAGMTADVRRRAFDPFFTTRRSQGGTGLGLHIVYNLVTARLGGEISLSSQLNAGTTFTILLPLRAPDEEETAASESSDQA